MAAAIEEDHAMGGAEEETTAAAAASPQISLNIMQTIRTAQMANGLKHGDYNRYRWVAEGGGWNVETRAQHVFFWRAARTQRATCSVQRLL